MDRITQSMVESFKNSQGIISNDIPVVFESFVNYCVVNNIYGTSDFDIEDITTGKATQGIDGIAIIINQKLVNSIEDIDLLISLNQTLSVKFVLIQTKTSSSFDNTEISNLFTYSNYTLATTQRYFRQMK